jgi:hypothetical protein
MWNYSVETNRWKPCSRSALAEWHLLLCLRQKQFIKPHRNIGPNNFKSQILNFKMLPAKVYTQLWNFKFEISNNILSVVGVLADHQIWLTLTISRSRSAPAEWHLFICLRQKQFIKTHRNIGTKNFKSQIVNCKIPTAKVYTQLWNFKFEIWNNSSCFNSSRNYVYKYDRLIMKIIFV